MKRILFVDDDPNILEDLSRMVGAQRCEWQIAFAKDAPQALAIRQADPYDIVVRH